MSEYKHLTDDERKWLSWDDAEPLAAALDAARAELERVRGEVAQLREVGMSIINDERCEAAMQEGYRIDIEAQLATVTAERDGAMLEVDLLRIGLLASRAELERVRGQAERIEGERFKLGNRAADLRYQLAAAEARIGELRALILQLGNCPDCGALWNYGEDRCDDDCLATPPQAADSLKENPYVYYDIDEAQPTAGGEVRTCRECGLLTDEQAPLRWGYGFKRACSVGGVSTKAWACECPAEFRPARPGEGGA